MTTKRERDHMARVAALGCIICGNPYVELHHPTGAGMGKKASNMDVIPLCHQHHRTGGFGIALHAGQRTWEEKHGTQQELLEKTKGRLNNDT